jgi:hypothetical protein
MEARPTPGGNLHRGKRGQQLRIITSFRDPILQQALVGISYAG